MNFYSEKIKILLIVILSILYLGAFRNSVYCQTAKKIAPKNSAAVKTSGESSREEFRILYLVNAERAKRRLNPLTWDDEVAKIAFEYSEKMARENFFSHFDSRGQGVLERAKSGKLKNWSKIGENLFSVEPVNNFDSFAVKNWMKSPTHRQNILDGEWTTTGIGIARSRDGEIFITQVFIKR